MRALYRATADQACALISCDLPERFWSFVEPEPLSGCWLWTGAWSKPRRGANHGQFWYEGRLLRPHRVLYEAVRGPISPGLHLDHLCRTPPCVRPSHLEPVTNAENIARGNRDRGAFPHTKIRPESLPAVYELCSLGHTPREIAAVFSVHPATISVLLRRWRGPAPRGKHSSRFRGVYLSRQGRWRAQIVVHRKAIYIGTFTTEEEAARAVETAERNREATP